MADSTHSLQLTDEKESSKEDTERYFKLFFLNVRGGTLILRALFLHIVETSSAKGDIDRFLSHFKAQINSLKSTRSIGLAAYRIVFPANGKTNISEWDVSLLSTILLRCCTVYGKLSDLLKSELENNVLNMGQYLTSKKADIDDMLRTQQLTDDQYKKLFPPDNGKRDTKSWDCELMAIVLLYFLYDIRLDDNTWNNVISREVKLFSSVDLSSYLENNLEKLKSQTPRNLLRSIIPDVKTDKNCTKWDARLICLIAVTSCQTLKITTIADIKTIRTTRNEVVSRYNTAEIDSITFNQKWKEMEKAICRIADTEIPNVKCEIMKAIRMCKGVPRDILHSPAQISDPLEQRLNMETLMMKIETTESNLKEYIDTRLSGLDERHERQLPDATTIDEDNTMKTMQIVDEHADTDQAKLQQLCNTYGLKSDMLKKTCDAISKRLLLSCPSYKSVWAAYDPRIRNNVVFVIITKDDKYKSIEMPAPLNAFECVYRDAADFNQENKDVMESQVMDTTRLTKDELTRIASILQAESKNLMQNHQNVNIISACPVKSKGYGIKNEEYIQKQTCITLFVHVKGLIPLGEDEFPSTVGGFPTDVREGCFEFYIPSTLKLGCAIGNYVNTAEGLKALFGSLGAFVDLSGRTCCLTSAHAVLDKTDLENLLLYGYYEIRETNESYKIYQPAADGMENSKPIGYVTRAVYKEGGNGETGVEAVLIMLTDPQSIPDKGEFPEDDFEHAGFRTQPVYMSGDIYTDITSELQESTFYKFGATTRMTRGAFCLSGPSVARDSLNLYGNEGCPLHNQIAVTTVRSKNENVAVDTATAPAGNASGVDFADHGDSGSLVLAAYNGNKDDLRAVGILTGGTNDKTQFFVTPIWEVLKALNLEVNLGLKNFNEIQYQRSEHSAVNIDLDSERKNEIHNIKENIKDLRETVTVQFAQSKAEMVDVQKKLEQKIAEGQTTTNDKLDALLDMLKRK